MKSAIIRRLLEEGYSPRAAELTAADLCAITDKEIRTAIYYWVCSHERTNVRECEFDCENLMADFKMTYPAALIFIDWYRTAPDEASKCIANQGG